MTMNKNMMRLILAMLVAAIVSISATAQVTTSEIVGTVSDSNGAAVVGATVTVVHEPTGSKSTSETNSEGRFNLPGLRVGGPYTVTVTAPGFKQQVSKDVTTSLGNASTFNFTLSVAEASAEVTVTGDETFSQEKTGASTNISNDVITTIPTTGRRINDFAKLSPFYGGGPFGGSIAGQDNRMNNITVDGSYFNNSFGLSAQPGERTGVSPISLEAVQELQINVAPYDVRQGNFVGAGINTVTKSGTNTYHGSAYYNFRNETFGGTKNGNLIFNRGQLDYKLWGFTVGGPLPYLKFGEGNGNPFSSGKDKAFFFFSYENEKTSKPAHTFTACNAGQTCQVGSVSRVKSADLDDLSAFLQSKFGYDPGAYQNYNFEIPATKFLFRSDWNLNNTNRMTLRYLRLRSLTDQPISTSGSSNTAGFGRGSQGLQFLSFQNSNYKIQENIDSYVGEWTSTFSPKVANSLIVGYTLQDESRPNSTKLFPLVDIHDGSTGTLSANTAYTSFGYEPFTPLNTLKYHSFQVQDNLSIYHGAHTFQMGMSYEKYHSLNIFYPSSQSIYVYRSIAEFKTDANAFLNGTASTVTPVRFNLRYNNIPGVSIPIQPLDVKYIGLYGQDQWKLTEKLNITYGLRVEVPFFGATGFANPLVYTLTFRDAKNQPLKLSTSKLPNANVLWSPRFGVNYSPFDWLQLRGGTGVFSARPPYVWISNQVGNNGVLTNVISQDQPNTTGFHFNPNPDRYRPTNVTGAPVPGGQDLNFTVPDYKFPAIWRSSAAADIKLPFNTILGTEFLYSKDVNGTAYINANLRAADTAFTGVDARPRWVSNPCVGTTGTAVNTRVNCAITNAITLTNSSQGFAKNYAVTLEKRMSHGFWAKGGYAYGISKNLVDASSTAGTSFSSVLTSRDPNNPELSYSSATMGHRVYGAASYHVDYFHFGGTTVSAFWESKTQSNNSYRYSNDMNGDGISGNDMLYIQKDASETIFVSNTTGGVTYTPAQQSAAWEAFIAQDPYLSSHRGQYALRNATWYPMRHQLDMSFSQDFHAKWMKAEHKLQLRIDILNFGNLLNHNWGGAVTPANNNYQPLAFASADAQGRPQYRLNTFSGSLITSTFTRRNSQADVYTYQLGLRYSF
jgi:hypothetical protein